MSHCTSPSDGLHEAASLEHHHKHAHTITNTVPITLSLILRQHHSSLIQIHLSRQ